MSKTFHFDTYQIHGKEISFLYHYSDETGANIGAFKEIYKIPTNISLNENDPTLQKILQHMHCLVGVSYYKSLLGDIVLPYALTSIEATYYNDIYDKGLGELAYVNQYTKAIRPFSATSNDAAKTVHLETSGAILGVGGGKDSVVAAEILKGITVPTTTLSVGTRDHHGQAGVVMDIMGLPQLHVERFVDTSISEFAKAHKGMRGHVPLSVLLAWVGVLLAFATKTKYVAMGNEGATSTGNIFWNGREVNHQWAKSLEQEIQTKQFVMSQISPDIQYISPIRPYSSLAVIGILSKLGENYLHDFTSCNLVLRIDTASRPNGRWCAHCAKCLSTWLLLSSWLDTERLVAIFGKNIWEDISLKPTLLALIGLEGHKPLDCVGTIEELRAVTRKAIDENPNSPLLEDIASSSIPGPSIDELVIARSTHCLEPELYERIEGFVENIITT
jgi:UDP-N-acetyl-alpha-D-muramoyl-L-alanyl-L-glutamate epimerase